MTRSNSKAELFSAMGLGPVWELKSVSVPEAQPRSAELLESAKPSEAAESIEPAKLVRTPADLPNLDQLRSTVAACRACGLCETRTQTVFSDGVPHAPLMVVGEAPGAEEDASGLPFVGRAGQLLDRMLTSVGASRASNVYIANVLKCRPPGNRNPEVAEIEQCSPFVFQQIAASQPKVLLLVGRFAIQTVLGSKKSVGELRGQLHQVTVQGRDIPAVVTYHPAYLLRRPEEKAKVWDDLLLLKQQSL
jgi:uracil-DNA glycosylase family 4